MTKKNLKFAVLAADTVMFAFGGGKLLVRLIEVHRPPYFTNHWGLPGGLIDPRETAEEAALNHLKRKGGIRKVYLEQLYTFSALKRDPRGRVVAVAYMGLSSLDNVMYSRKDGVSKGEWFSVDELPRLAYDHKEIINKGLMRLRAKLGYTNIARMLLPRQFTLAELQGLYEKILGRKLDKRNFRKKILAVKLVVPGSGEKRGLPSRPAQLWKFADTSIRIVEIL